VFLVQTVAELTLSPVGLSVTTRMAPVAFASQLLGLWFLAVAVGDAAGGQAAKLLPTLGEPLYFTVLGALAVAVGIGLALGGRRLVGDADRTRPEPGDDEDELVSAGGPGGPAGGRGARR
jgi:POT family proton-dependent oligopeptide transporter